MGKQNYLKLQSRENLRDEFRQALRAELFTLFSANVNSEEIDSDTLNFILRKLYSDGEVALSLAVGAKSAMDYLPNEEKTNFLVATEFSPVGFGYLDLPLKVQLINPHGVKFINKNLLTPNKDVVIMHACKNRIIPQTFVFSKIEQMVKILMTIDTNLNALKVPFLIRGRANKQTNASLLVNALLNDEIMLFLDANDSTTYNVLNTNAKNEINNLYSHFQQIKNEVYSFLGIDNAGGFLKAEHLNTDEVNSNNSSIDIFANNIKSGFKESEKKIKATFGLDVNFKFISEKVLSIHEDKKEENEEGENENDNQSND